MARRKAEVYILSLLLLAAAVFCFFLEGEGRPELFFRVGSETIRVWENQEGESFVFLPSYVNLNDLKIRTNKPQPLDGRTLTDGMDCSNLELNRAYTRKNGETLTFVQSENLPALYLDTASGNLDYIHAKKGNRESGALRLYGPDGSLNAAGTLREVKARGNSTFAMEKKPYSLTLSKKVDLLGMGPAENWILLANALDGSHLKNKFVYDFAAQAGLPYAPESRFVDLYLNGEYAGLYLLCQRNELAPGRVEVKDGFLVSKEQLYNLENVPYFETNAGACLRVRQNTLGATQMQRIFQQAENAILAPDGVDPDTGKHFSQFIDLDSWAGKYLVEEMFDGIDASIGSQFFFYDASQDRLFAGPVWDYDDTIGAGIWLGGEYMLDQVPEIFYAHRSKESPWFHSLYYDPVFYGRLTDLYRERFAPLLETYLTERLPEYADLIRQSARLNRLRWGGRDMDAEVEKMVRYLTSRMEFLNAAWIEQQELLEVHVNYSYEGFLCTYAIFDYAVPSGGFLPELPQMEGLGWYYTGTDTPFDPGRPILEETAIELREIP